MHPVHDIDVLLLQATALASKRRPAELPEILAAAELILGNIPFEQKIRESFQRLAAHGLVVAADGGITLTPAGQAIMEGVPKKAKAEERVVLIKDMLDAHPSDGELALIEFTSEQVIAAIAAHRNSKAGTGKNLLMPKSETAERNYKRPAWRPSGPPRKRKS